MTVCWCRGDAHLPPASETLDLPTYSGNSVHFSDVLRGAGKKVMQEEISSRGATLEEIPSDHGVHAKWDRIKSKTKSIMSRYTAQQLLAADQIKDCFNVFLFRKSLAGRTCTRVVGCAVPCRAHLLGGRCGVQWKTRQMSPTSRCRRTISEHSTRRRPAKTSTASTRSCERWPRPNAKG